MPSNHGRREGIEPLANPTRKRREVRPMRRLVSVLLGSILLLIALTSPVAGQTPIDERRQRSELPLGSQDVTIAPEIGCSEFPVLVEDIAGKITYVFITEDRHGNVLERIIFRTTSRYTNTETGASFEQRFDSVANYTTFPDGSLHIRFRADALLWYAPGDPSEDLGPGVWLVDGGFGTESYDAEGNLTNATLKEAREILDVCAMLS